MHNPSSYFCDLKLKIVLQQKCSRQMVFIGEKPITSLQNSTWLYTPFGRYFWVETNISAHTPNGSQGELLKI
ncbi:unnamed protein product [Blepharisma stoltei]|uniref:Uncharacterized protein n=1 Tax=Blepharisma stoltei TaxID=1481888 RepID=A0AAU9JWC5_9CILI|nr:unnamed protein product [Blepharisma stoltei]